VSRSCRFIEYLSGDLGVSEGGNSGEDLALEELKTGSSTGGYVAHLVGLAGLLDGSDGVSSTNDGAGSLGGDLLKNVNDRESTLGEGVELENSHRSVPDDCLAVGEGSSDLLGGLRSVVESHPSVRDGSVGNDLGVGVGGECISDKDVGGEDELRKR